MSYTTNNNLPLLPAGAVDWLAAYNDAMAKIEAGATLYLQAGEALAVRDCFYIKSDGKAWKATTATACDGIWQSTSTAAGAWGFGQIGGTMTYASWAWTPGSLLYSNGSGALTTTETPYLVAIAKSATEISLIKPHTHKVITASNTGLKVLDTNASQYLIIKPGSDLSADRTLTLTTGDADRTITLSGNPTLADWFDQSVKTTDSPTYATVKCTGLTDTALPKHTSDATGLQDSVIKEDASGNLLFNGATAGTALAKGQSFAAGTAPTTSPADIAQVYVADPQGAAGYARLHERTEDGKASGLALLSEVSDSLGALSPVQRLKSLNSAVYAPITVEDNDNIDMSTNDITLHFEGLLPDWTPSAAVYFEHKLESSVGYAWGVSATTGYLFVTLNADTYTLSLATNFVDGSPHKISAVISRGTTQTLQFYVDKLPFGTAQTITTSASATVSNAKSLYILGSAATTRHNGTLYNSTIFNRALTAAQVYSLHSIGVDYSDQYGNCAALNVSSCVNSNYDTFDGASATGFHVVYTTSGTQICGTADEIALALYKRYRLTFTAVLTSGQAPSVQPLTAFGGSTVGLTAQTVTSGVNTFEFSSTTTQTGVVQFSNTAAAEYTISDLSLIRTGVVLDLPPEGIQQNQWLDNANGLHATIPASGVTALRRMEHSKYIWSTAMTDDTTWTSIVPAGYELERVIFLNSTANTCTLRLGTSAGGTEAIASISIGASGYTTALCNKPFSLTAATTLYLSDTGGGWGSCSLTAVLFFRRIN